MASHNARRPHDRRIGIVLLLPGAKTQHGYWRRGGLVVTGGDGAAGEGANAEGLKIVAGDEFTAQRFGQVIVFATAHAELYTRRLERGHLRELRSRRLEAE